MNRIALNVVLPPLIASLLWALVECAHTSAWSELPVLIFAMTLCAYLFAGAFCLLHAALMELTYLKIPPAHPLAVAVASASGFTVGAALSYLLTRDIFGSTAHVPLAFMGTITGLILGLIMAILSRKRSVKAIPVTLSVRL